jgi:hypothetical protein
MLIYVTISGDTNVTKEEAEEFLKHKNLTRVIPRSTSDKARPRFVLLREENESQHVQ